MNGAMWQVAEPMQIGKLNGITLYVGGAEGVERLAEEFGKQHDMNVEVILNPLHPRARFITPLNVQEMNDALPYVFKANETLQRSLSIETLNKGYLQRNYCIVKRAATLFAFGKFERGIHKTTLEGETGWVLQMAINEGTKTVFVFDVLSKQWYQVKHDKRNIKFVPCRKPYLGFSTNAIVGMQYLSEDTCNEVKNLFTRSLNIV